MLRTSDVLIYIFLLIALIFIEKLYFSIAERLHIIDSPNHRSSHQEETILGGGVIFPIAAIFGMLLANNVYFYFTAGLLLVTVLSFWDDVIDLKYSFRTFFQILAVSLLLHQLDLQLSFYWYPLIIVFLVGTINAYNFMDGINGITGGSSLITLLTLLYVDQFVHPFINDSLLVSLIIGTMVFNYFNFRTKARCFAGDVGSVSMAFILSFLIVQLIIASDNYLYAGFLLLYGLDTVSTIIFRVFRKEFILEAHRTHFYQFLVNERKWKHLSVAAMYSVVQLGINILIILVSPLSADSSLIGVSLLSLVSAFLFVGVRFFVEGKKHLLEQHEESEPAEQEVVNYLEHEKYVGFDGGQRVVGNK